jgi:hypothetical protein
LVAFAAQPLVGLADVAGDVDRVAALPQSPGDGLRQALLIVHDQDPHRCAPPDRHRLVQGCRGDERLIV